MDVVKIEVEVPKETWEIAKFFVDLIVDIKAGKSTSEVVAENLAGLVTAIEGFEKLSEEVKSKDIYAAAALIGADLVSALMAKKEA